LDFISNRGIVNSKYMGNFAFNVPVLGAKFKDYRSVVAGDSFNWAWVRPMSQPTYLTIHHSAGPDTQTPEEIANYHVQSRGWGGIGYHFLIGKDGTVYYVGDLTTARANVLNMNELVIGICLIGTFMNGAVPPDVQLNSCHELCSQLLFRTPDLSGVNAWTDVVPHKQLNATECPGDTWDIYKSKIINGTGIPVPTPNPIPNTDQRRQDITNIYLTVLGRAPDSQGLDSYVNSGLTVDQIRKNITESAEHQQILARANAYNKILEITKIGS
jgi:hypothetical protein